MGREAVTLQLWRGNRRVGPPLGAHADWRERGELRRYLLDALDREGYPARRVGEFRLEVRRADNDRHLTDFVTTHDERRR